MRVYILYLLYLRMRVYILYLHMRVYILYLLLYLLYLRMRVYTHSLLCNLHTIHAKNIGEQKIGEEHSAKNVLAKNMTRRNVRNPLKVVATTGAKWATAFRAATALLATDATLQTSLLRSRFKLVKSTRNFAASGGIAVASSGVLLFSIVQSVVRRKACAYIISSSS